MKEATKFPDDTWQLAEVAAGPVNVQAEASFELKPLPVTPTAVPGGPMFGLSEIWAVGVPTVKTAKPLSPVVPPICIT